MTLYIGMSQATARLYRHGPPAPVGPGYSADPQGSRIARREYGSLLSELIDQPQNPALRLQVMSAVYVALSRWEPRLTSIPSP